MVCPVESKTRHAHLDRPRFLISTSNIVSICPASGHFGSMPEQHDAKKEHRSAEPDHSGSLVFAEVRRLFHDWITRTRPPGSGTSGADLIESDTGQNYFPAKLSLDPSGSRDYGAAEYRVDTDGPTGISLDSRRSFARTMPRRPSGAKRLVDGHDVELWSGDRFAVRLSRPVDIEE
jgi:hypothetical protein